MSKKTQQTVTIIVLCVLLIGAGVGYYALVQHQAAQQKKEAESEENAGIELYSLEQSQIEKIYFKSKKAEMTLVKDKKWKVQGEKDFPLDQNRVEFMLGAVSSLTADKLVTENATDLEQFQLAEPVLLIKFQDSEGNEKTIAVGEESLSGGGRYAYCDDSSTIYIVPTSIYSNFDYTKKELKAEE